MMDDAGFEIVPIEHKGLGVRARRAYRRGEMILCEPAILVGSHGHRAALEQRYDALTTEKQRQVMMLSDCHADGGEKTVFGVMGTNSLPLGAGATTSGLFPIVSRFNHSCAANVHHAWNANLSMETVFANEDIPAGAELCNCYIDRLRFPDRTARRARLRRAFGFDCACEACALPVGAARIKSNQRRRKIAVHFFSRAFRMVPYESPGFIRQPGPP